MRKPSKEFGSRTFVEFILEPLYKIMVHTVSHERKQLQAFLLQLGIYLKKAAYKTNTKKLLKTVC